MRIGKRAIAIVALAALLAPAILLIAPWTVGGKQAHVVLSDSMSPALRAGDLVVLSGFDYWTTEVRVGDIVAYQPSGPRGPIVLHRVVGIDRSSTGMEYYLTKGDANNAPDPNPVGKNTVVGKYALDVPLYGHLVLFAKSKLGILFLIVLPSVAIAAGEVVRLNRLAPGKKSGTAPPAAVPTTAPATFEVVRR